MLLLILSMRVNSAMLTNTLPYPHIQMAEDISDAVYKVVG